MSEVPYSQASTLLFDEIIYYDDDSESSSPSVPWGRLYPARKSVKFHDLTGSTITVGKNSLCEVCVGHDELPSSMWGVFSRQHFQIKRVTVEAVGAVTYKIILEDMSMNGTFVNGVKVGKGQSKEISDNAIISIGRPQFEVYHFHDCEKDSAGNNRFPLKLTKKYDISKRLGSGAFGEVYLVFHKETGKGYAMKTILKEGTLNPAKLRNELIKLDNEITILKDIKHPNVIQLLDSLDCGKDKFIFLELMEGKDLFHRIVSCTRLTESQCKLYFYQILSGVQYLHSKGIFHRDLKPENVLLATGDVDTVVKITDFGLSKVLHSQTYLYSLCGTKMYVAPEVLESEGLKKYTGQVDVWSMGVILYVCLSGQTPFSEEKDATCMTIEDQIKMGQFKMEPSRWECVSNAAKRLVKSMMTVNPDRRITVPDVFQSAWLQDDPMKARVRELLAEFELTQMMNSLPVPYSQEERQDLIFSVSDKENVPKPVSSDDDTFPASLKFLSSSQSSSLSPRRKRAKV